LPPDEQGRLKKVISLGLLDTKPEERFDAITKAAVEQLHVPIATVTIVDEKREWYKSCQGLDMTEAPREVSFCAHAMLSSEIFIVEDTLKDERFKDNPMVTGYPHIRFYAGVSLHSQEGIAIGVFCIKDTKPRTLSPAEIATLMELASMAEKELNRPV
jgi:GAF domain-containing protein